MEPKNYPTPCPTISEVKVQFKIWRRTRKSPRPIPEKLWAAAVGLPIISGEVLLGILTLKHSAPNHFTPEIVELMRITSTQVAMVLENTCLFSNLNNSLRSLGSSHQKIKAYSRALEQELEKCRQIQQNF